MLVEMGSGPSRGKRVAPACVSEVNVSKTRAFKPDSRIFKPLNIHSILRSNRAPADSHSDGPEFFAQDGELDAVLPGCDSQVKKSAFVKVRTYGLCSFGRGDAEEDPNCTSKTKKGTERSRGSGDINKISNDAFTNFKRRAQHPTSQNPRGPPLEAVPTSENHCTLSSCYSSSMAAPVALYDGSDEELMDTIERDFS